MFLCEICSKSFNHKWNMQRHVKEVHYGKKRYDIGDTLIHQSQQFRNKQFDNNQFGKEGVVKDVIPPSSHMRSQQLNEFKNEQSKNEQFENKQFENKQFENKQFENRNGFDIRLKENFKLFILGPSRCGKTVFVSKLLENIQTFAKIPPTNVLLSLIHISEPTRRS